MVSSGGNLQIVDIEFETLQDFREIMAPRFNYDGFFIEKTDPLPRGTRAKFRFVLPDGYVLAEGTGVVAWSRYEEEGPHAPAGMALLFDAMDQQNREVVDELVEFHRSTGGEPFDLGPRASEAGEIGTDALSGDVFDVPPSPDSAIPSRPETGTEDMATESGRDYLPDWLSEVAQRHEIEYVEEGPASTDEVREDADDRDADEPEDAGGLLDADDNQVSAESGEVTRPAMPELDASLFQDDGIGAVEPENEVPDVVLLEREMPDVGVFEEEYGDAPFRDDAAPSPEVTLPARDAFEKPRDLRMRYIVPVVVVLVAASAIVFWIVNRTIPIDVSEAEPVEEVRISQTPAVQEETFADTVAVATGEAAGKPVAVAESTSDEAVESEGVFEPAERPAPTAPASRLLLVTASRAGEETVVTVRANGELTEGTVRVVLLQDPPRVWVRITGIETFYRPNEIAVGTPEVERLRVGHHPEETPQSIYVVADLASSTASIRDHTVEGDTLRVVIAR